MIRYKTDVMKALKGKGFTAYKLRKDKILGESDMTNIRRGRLPSHAVLNKLCRMLECQPGDLLEYVEDDNSYCDTES